MYQKKVLDLIEENSIEMSEYPKQWIEHARLLLAALGRFRMFEEFDKEQHRIRSIIDKISETKKTQNLNAEIYNTIYNVKLDMDIDRGLFEQSAKYAEEARVAVRNIRRHSMDELKQNERDANISKDAYHDYSQEVQKLTDNFVNSIDEVLAHKNREITQV